MPVIVGCLARLDRRGAAVRCSVHRRPAGAPRPALAWLGLTFVYMPLLLLAGGGARAGAARRGAAGRPRARGCSRALTLALARGWWALAVACALTVARLRDRRGRRARRSPRSRCSGPNPVLGVRFFGIGNELEATLAVLVPVGVGAGLTRGWRRAGGRPSAGTAVGAFLAAGLLCGRGLRRGPLRRGRRRRDRAARRRRRSPRRSRARAVRRRPAAILRRRWRCSPPSASALAALALLDLVTRRRRPPHPLGPRRRRRRRPRPTWPSGGCGSRPTTSPRRPPIRSSGSLIAGVAVCAICRRRRIAAWLEPRAARPGRRHRRGRGGRPWECSRTTRARSSSRSAAVGLGACLRCCVCAERRETSGAERVDESAVTAATKAHQTDPLPWPDAHCPGLALFLDLSGGRQQARRGAGGAVPRSRRSRPGARSLGSAGRSQPPPAPLPARDPGGARLPGSARPHPRHRRQRRRLQPLGLPRGAAVACAASCATATTTSSTCTSRPPRSSAGTRPSSGARRWSAPSTPTRPRRSRTTPRTCSAPAAASTSSPARIAVSEAAAWTGRRWFGGEYTIVPNGVDVDAAPQGPKPPSR